MIRYLFLMRHSVTEGFASSDFERRLTGFGEEKAKQQTIKLESFLKENRLSFDHCFYSNAQRAKQTFHILSKTMDDACSAQGTRALYLTGMRELKKVLKDYQEDIEQASQLLVIGHNFGISDIASMLSGVDLLMDPADVIGLKLELDDERGKKGYQENWNHLLEYEGNWEIIYGR